MYNGVRLLDRPSMANVHRLDMACLPLIVEMQHNGMLIDKAHFRALADKLLIAHDRILHQITHLLGAPLNPHSGDQVGQVLFHELQLIPPGGKISLTPTGKLSTDDDTLAALATQHPVVALIQECRELQKIRTTYAIPLPLTAGPDDRVHTLIKTTRAATGRLATGDAKQGLRNLQNIPTRGDWGTEVRNGFVAAPGCVIVSLDLAQIEMVWAAHLSQCPAMMQVFHDNSDIHTMTAINMFRLDPSVYIPLMWKDKRNEPMDVLESKIWKKFKREYRLPAKTLGFAVLFGVTGQGLQRQILAAGGPYWTVAECEEFIAKWFAVYPEVLSWMRLQFQKARRFGMVWDEFGRIRRIPGAQSVLRWLAEAALREAGNMPIQGSAQGTIKMAMGACGPIVAKYKAQGRCLPLMQIHDELLFEVERQMAEEFIADMRNLMEHVVEISVPIRSSGDYAESWGGVK